MMQGISRGLSVCTFMTLSGLSFAEIAFPDVDAGAYCRMIMDSNPATKADPGLLLTCLSGDLEAQDEARSRWKATTPDIRQQCVQLSKLNGQYSYQHILGCIRYLEQRI